MSLIQNIIDIIRGKKNIIPKLIETNFARKHLGYYSQYGEDIILSKFLRRTKNGFYIDIGANHPTLLSNTKYFYEKGFRGINIEPNPNLIENFYVQRPEDINLNVGISPTDGELTFYILEADTLSTFNPEAAKESCNAYKTKITEEIKIKTIPLVKIIEKHASAKTIDFMSIDTEGYDLEVLQSNDWKKYRPRFVIIEVNRDSKNILDFMLDNKYKAVYKNHTNCIFKACD